MKHIGIDLGGRESQVCIRSSSGEILGEARSHRELLGPTAPQATDSCLCAIASADTRLRRCL